MRRIGKAALAAGPDPPRETRGVTIMLEVSIARVMDRNGAADGSDLVHL